MDEARWVRGLRYFALPCLMIWITLLWKNGSILWGNRSMIPVA
jgi:hypothetical protein